MGVGVRSCGFQMTASDIQVVAKCPTDIGTLRFGGPQFGEVSLYLVGRRLTQFITVGGHFV